MGVVRGRDPGLVRDRELGLAWERGPDLVWDGDLRTWSGTAAWARNRRKLEKVQNAFRKATWSA